MCKKIAKMYKILFFYQNNYGKIGLQLSNTLLSITLNRMKKLKKLMNKSPLDIVNPSGFRIILKLMILLF